MTIRPLSSRVIFVAPRNMAVGATVAPFPPTFSHRAPLYESGASYVNSNSEKFVAFTKTYVESTYVKNNSVAGPAAHSLLTISGLATNFIQCLTESPPVRALHASKAY